MSGTRNLAVRVVGAPAGLPEPSDFEVVELPMPEPREGEVLFRSTYMSIHPSMRRRMPYPVETPGPIGWRLNVGDLMIGGQTPPEKGWHGSHAGEVVASRHPGFKPGDFVVGGTYWQTFHAMPGDLLFKADPARVSLRRELGVMGSSAFVAYCGMETIGQVKAGETCVVSAAGGSIGMVAGQMARIAGARVVGIASGEKCDFVVRELGFDACIDRNQEPVGAGLDRECPNGVDVYFDNVGGEVQRACFDRLNTFGRLVYCGAASEYNTPEGDHGPPLRSVLRKRLKIQGFVVYDHDEALYPEFRRRMAGWLAGGEVRYRDEIVSGLENAPAALIALLKGENRGKVLVQVSPDRSAV